MKRIPWIDNLKFAAVCLVILCHSTESIYTMKASSLTSMSNSTMIFAISAFILGRSAVPLFFMISGYFNLRNEFSHKGDVILFYRKKLVPLIMSYWIWILVYTFFNILMMKHTFDPIVLLRRLFLLTQVSNTFWYLPALIMLLVLTPILAKITQFCKEIDSKIPVIFLFVLLFIPDINRVLVLLNIPIIDNIFSFNPSAFYPIIYYCTGYVVITNSIDKKRNGLSETIVNFVELICIFLVIVIYTLVLTINGTTFNIWYSSPLLIIMGITVIKIYSELQILSLSTRFGNFVAKYSLGYYLIHVIIIGSVTPIINGIKTIMPVKVILCTLLLFLITTCLIYLVRRFKIIRKYLFLH